MGRLRYSASGVVLVELALSLTLALLFTLTTIDFGFSIRELNVILSASRSGARSAASASVTHASFWCSTTTPLSRSETCTTVEGWPTSVSSLPAEQQAIESALRMSCAYLNEAGYTSSDWRVTVRAPLLVSEGVGSLSAVVRRIAVRIERAAPSERTCPLCFSTVGAASTFAGQSEFALQVECSP